MPGGIVYCIINKVNNKQYIGQTIRASWVLRWRQHLRSVRDGSQQPIHNAIRKYGICNFKVKVVCKCGTQDRLNHMEEFWANKLKTFAPNGYNLRAGGQFQRVHAICCIPGCGKEHCAKGYCKYHWGVRYQQAIKDGGIQKLVCSEVGCTKVAVSYGLCPCHRARVRYGHKPRVPKEEKLSRLDAYRMYVVEGLTTTCIASKIKCPPVTTWKIIKGYGIPIRKRGIQKDTFKS